MFSEVLQILTELGANKRAILKKSDALTVQKRSEQRQIRRKITTQLTNVILSSQISEQKYAMISQKLSQKSIKVKLERNINIGRLFENFGQLNSLFSDKPTFLFHQPGKILCLFFWSLWAERSFPYFNLFQKLLVKEQKWKEEIIVIGISLYSKKQNVQKFVEYKKWCKAVHHSIVNENEEHPLIQNFKIKSLPYIILVDKFGRVNFAGSPVFFDIEKNIRILLQQKNEDEQFCIDSFILLKRLEKYAENISLSANQELKDLEQFCFKMLLSTDYINSQVLLKGNIKATIFNDDPVALKKVYSFLGNHPEIELKINAIDCITIPSTQEVKCWKCANILQFPFYWLKWEEEISFGCRQCVEERSTFEGHHYKYEKNAVLLMRKWNKLAAKNMGNNLQPLHPKHISHEHQFHCSGCCHTRRSRTRYICQGCRMLPSSYFDGYVDFCQTCFQEHATKRLALSKQLQRDGHQLDHPILRVLYHNGEHQNF